VNPVYEPSLHFLAQAFWELEFAFRGLADERVWTRPAPPLLSVGEIAGHMAYWEAVRLAGEGEDLTKCRIASPLVDARFRYYPRTLANPPAEHHLVMTADAVYRELIRVHEAAFAHFEALNPDPDTKIVGCPARFTYAKYLEYAVFHTAYHTGQIYSVRHLLGEGTEDN